MRAVDFPMSQGLWEVLYDTGRLTGQWADYASIPYHYRRGVKFSVDRSGALPAAFLQNVTPMPTYNASFSQTLQQVGVARAEAILAENKPIKLYWSGGIDSTLALLAFVAAGGYPRNWITVVTNDAALQEAPSLPGDFNRFKLELDNRGAVPFSGIDKDTAHLHVTGELGDYITTGLSQAVTYDMRVACAADQLVAPWRDVVILGQPQYSTEQQPLARLNPAQEAAVEALVAACPFTVTTMFQYVWWRNFATRWQTVWMRMGARHSAAEFPGYMANVRHFYAGDDFQRWAMVYWRDNPIPNANWLLFKKPLKDLIKFLWNDDTYYQTKGKDGSLLSYPAGWGRFEDYSIATSAAETAARLAA